MYVLFLTWCFCLKKIFPEILLQNKLHFYKIHISKTEIVKKECFNIYFVFFIKFSSKCWKLVVHIDLLHIISEVSVRGIVLSVHDAKFLGPYSCIAPWKNSKVSRYKHDPILHKAFLATQLFRREACGSFAAILVCLVEIGNWVKSPIRFFFVTKSSD